MTHSRNSMLAVAAAIGVLATSPALAAGGGGAGSLPYAESPDKHFHPKGKPPSKHTLEVINKARKTFPFADKKDFEEAQKGFIAAPDSLTIKADAGHVAWDVERYQFLTTGTDFDSVHPSLQRQSTLNQKTGLFKVRDDIYQVRNFDLANVTFVKGKTGWIVFDPATAAETARAAKELVDKHLGQTAGRSGDLLPLSR